MPDTLLIVLASMIFFIFLTFLPYYIWISQGEITLYNLLYGRQNLPEPPIRVKVANLALNNYKETYPLFLGLSILGISLGIPIQTASLFWLTLRLIHTPCYIFEWNWMRTLSWQISILCLFWMMFQIISLNRLTMFTHF